MFTVALVGPDGAGKTTVCQRLAESLPLPTTYVYMGINLEASNVVLPTTRLLLELKRALGRRPDMSGPADPARRKPPPRGPVQRLARATKASLRLVNQLGEEWFRQLIIWFHVRRGRIVLFDRHFFLDYFASDVAPTGEPRPLSRRIHGFVLDRLYPKPDLVIVLDAPADLLFARKGEGSVALIEGRRQEYRDVRSRFPHYHVVDVRRPLEEVVRSVTDLVLGFAAGRTDQQPELLGDRTL